MTGGVNGHVAQTVHRDRARAAGPRPTSSRLLTTRQVSLDEAKGDKKGPMPLGSAVSARGRAGSAAQAGRADAPKPETRVAVIGDSDFAANGTLGMPGNRDLFMNTIGWLSQQDNLISIRPKEADDRRITLTATQESNIIWLSLLIIPGFVFGAGVYDLVAAEG